MINRLALCTQQKPNHRPYTSNIDNTTHMFMYKQALQRQPDEPPDSDTPAGTTDGALAAAIVEAMVGRSL